MNVLRLGFENFRNLCPGEIFPGETINVIHGSNAQGKTNLLEAIWLFTGGHSFRGTKDSELPVLKDGKNAPAASLSMTLFTEGREQELRLELRDGRRSSVINGVEKKTGSALVGKFCAVIFSPEHLLLVKEGPSRRRAFLDGALCQSRPAFTRVLAHYNKALMQRNALLKDIPRHPELIDTLDVWDERLILFGTEVVQERAAFCKDLEPRAAGNLPGYREKQGGNHAFLRAVWRCGDKNGDCRAVFRSAEKRQKCRCSRGVYVRRPAQR